MKTSSSEGLRKASPAVTAPATSRPRTVSTSTSEPRPPACTWTRPVSGSTVGGRRPGGQQRRQRPASLGTVRHGKLHDVAADAVLEHLGGTRSDHKPVVDNHDVVGQLVGFVKVLGAQQESGPLGHQLPDYGPHPEPAAGVEPRRRLVQEQDPRPA